jgi:hypothetical protein
MSSRLLKNSLFSTNYEKESPLPGWERNKERVIFSLIFKAFSGSGIIINPPLPNPLPRRGEGFRDFFNSLLVLCAKLENGKASGQCRIEAKNGGEISFAQLIARSGLFPRVPLHNPPAVW